MPKFQEVLKYGWRRWPNTILIEKPARNFGRFPFIIAFLLEAIHRGHFGLEAQVD
jgi:hypothetical protein